MNVLGKKVGFIGTGNMASALISGMISAGFKPNNIFASSPGKEHLDSLSSVFDIQTSADNADVFKASEIIVFAVKPNKLKTVLEEFNKGNSAEEKLIISVAAGIKISDIELHLSRKQRIIRAMPNTPSSIGMGVTAICQNKNTTKHDVENAEELFGCVGKVVQIQEEAMDFFTALIGSGPAYVFYLIESLLESSKDMKVDEKMRKDMISSMIAGSAELALISENSPQQLRENVTSPGGVTEKAIEEFDKNNFKEAILKAINEAVNRSIELGDNQDV